jgi:serine protease Do
MWTTWLCTVAAAGPVTLPAYEPPRSLAPLVEAVAPAVVTLEIESVGRMPDLPAEVLRSLPFDPRGMPHSRSGEGSGFFVSPSEILTNFHVVDDASSVIAVTADGRRLSATVIGSDRSLDLALLKVESDEPWLSLGDSDALRVGDWVLAIGNGLGLGSSATVGVVSGRGRAVSHEPLASDFIQTDAAINEGNSGGPLFTLDGRVVGMSTATITGANTVGFAIPANRIRDVLDDLRAAGHVRRGYLGLSPDDAPQGGAMVVNVQEGTPADRAGLRAGDRILTVDGEAIDDARDLVVTVSSRSPGRRVTVALEREGREKELTVELGARPEAARGPAPTGARPGPETTWTEEHTVLDLTLRSRATTRGDGVEAEGVEVVAVGDGSPFRGRLQPGDRVLSVNRHAVSSASEVAHVLRHSGGDVTFEVSRAGARTVVVAPLSRRE